MESAEGRGSPRLSVAANLVEDERLLAAAAPSWRVAEIAGPSMTLGVAQAGEPASAARAQAARIPVVRRRSGGTGLIHEEGDLAWAIVLPRSDPRVGRDFARAYSRLGAAVVEALSDLGLDAEWTPSAGVSDEFCLLARTGHALTVRGRAIGGAAQHLTRTALLHHGSLSVRVDRARLRSVFEIPMESLTHRVTSVAEEAPGGTISGLRPAVERRLARWVSS